MIDKFRNIVILTSMFLILNYDFACAYIDPSTGSYVIQFLLAGLLGALFAIKSYWRNIKHFFSKKTSERKNDTV